MQNTCIRLYTDNSGVKQAVNKGFSSTSSIRDKLLQVHALLRARNCQIYAQHIPGEENVVADALSRTNLGDSYRLHRVLFKMIQLVSIPATIDRFACSSNAQLPLYNTLFKEPGSHGVDAFSQEDYLEHVNFVFPPIAMLPRVSGLFLRAWPQARAIFVFPRWTSQPWYNNYMDMCEACFVLPHSGSKLFEKVHEFPAHKPVRNEYWQFVVGFRNLPIHNNPQWLKLKWTSHKMQFSQRHHTTTTRCGTVCAHWEEVWARDRIQRVHVGPAEHPAQLSAQLHPVVETRDTAGRVGASAQSHGRHGLQRDTCTTDEGRADKRGLDRRELGVVHVWLSGAIRGRGNTPAERAGEKRGPAAGERVAGTSLVVMLWHASFGVLARHMFTSVCCGGVDAVLWVACSHNIGFEEIRRCNSWKRNLVSDELV